MAGLWPQMLTGLAVAVILALRSPSALPWAVPTVVSLALCVPFTCLTAAPMVGRWFQRHGLCAVPDDLDPAPEVRAVINPAPDRDAVPADAVIAPAAAAP
jgi:membrane glycosyltransferase